MKSYENDTRTRGLCHLQYKGLPETTTVHDTHQLLLSWKERNRKPDVIEERDGPCKMGDNIQFIWASWRANFIVHNKEQK